MQRLRWTVAVALAAALALGGTAALAAPVPSDSGAEGVLTVKPATLAGKLLYSDQRTPVVNAVVRVWSVDKKKFVHETRTDEEGAYELPKLAPGRYILVFADRVRVNLVVDETKGLVDVPLNVVVPRGTALITPKQLAAELTKFPAGGQMSLATTGLIVLGGAAVLYGGYRLYRSNQHKSHKKEEVKRRGRRARAVVSP